jgi:hypothetical protein
MSQITNYDKSMLKIINHKPDRVDKFVDPRWAGLTYDVDQWKRVWTYDKDGKLICGAIKRDGSPCHKHPMTGRNKCKLHGGASLIGAQHPGAKTLKYSKDIVGKRFADTYTEAMTDPKLLELKDDIAITQARVAELLKNVDYGESIKAWKTLRKLYDDFIFASRMGNADDAAECITEIGKLIKNGYDQNATWEEIYKAQSHKRKLTETENKRQNELNQMMTHEQAMNLLTFVASVIKQRVAQFVPGEKGQELMATIGRDISAHMSQGKKVKQQSSASDDF